MSATYCFYLVFILVSLLIQFGFCWVATSRNSRSSLFGGAAFQLALDFAMSILSIALFNDSLCLSNYVVAFFSQDVLIDGYVAGLSHFVLVEGRERVLFVGGEIFGQVGWQLLLDAMDLSE